MRDYMKEDIVSFQTAKLAKEKGFDWECLYAYSVWRENLRKSDTEETALRGIEVEYEPYMGGSYGEVRKFYQSKQYTLAPTKALLQKWLREEHDIHVYVCLDNAIHKTYYVDVCIKKEDYDDGYLLVYETDLGEDYSYEEALEKGLQEALKLLINNEKMDN